MKIGSDCSGSCCLCGYSGHCLAGHGDDDYYLASKEALLERYDKTPDDATTFDMQWNKVSKKEMIKNALMVHYSAVFTSCVGQSNTDCSGSCTGIINMEN